MGYLDPFLQHHALVYNVVKRKHCSCDYFLLCVLAAIQGPRSGRAWVGFELRTFQSKEAALPFEPYCVWNRLVLNFLLSVFENLVPKFLELVKIGDTFLYCQSNKNCLYMAKNFLNCVYNYLTTICVIVFYLSFKIMRTFFSQDCFWFANRSLHLLLPTKPYSPFY